MPSRTRPDREALFVLTPTPDGTPAYQNVTARLGRPLRLSQPKAVVALEVYPDVLAFSYQQLTKKAAQQIKASPLVMPHKSLSFALRRAQANLELDGRQLLVIVDKDTYTLNMEADNSGMVSIEGTDYAFEMPVQGVRMTLVLRSPRTGRLMSIAFAGYANAKPGETIGVIRAASMALFALTQLSEFRILAGFDSVHVPSARAQVAPKASDRVTHTMPLRLFTDDAAPQFLGEGALQVEVDVMNANPATGKLLFHLTPEESILEAFESATYRRTVSDSLATEMLNRIGSDEVSNIALEIVLGSLTAGQVEMLRETLRQLPGLDVTPTRYALRTS